MIPQIDRAERLARQRSGAAIALGVVLVATQAQRMDHSGVGPVSWVVTGLAAAIFLVWASGFVGGPALRAVLNDESSDLSRRRSLTLAFWTMITAAAVCYILTYFRDYGPRDAIQIIMTVGASSALISFGAAERAALRK